jgi:hypothetical protein
MAFASPEDKFGIKVQSRRGLAAFAFIPAGTEGMNIAIAGVYALAAVLGFTGYLSSPSIPTSDRDNWLHVVSALAPLILGSGLVRAMGGRQAAIA